jgi:CheY-like chemotaxis protein
MKETFHIVLADDDLDDQELIKKAFESVKVKVDVSVVYNGLQLMDYLLKREAYRRIEYNAPDLVLLDLNMPLMDGFDVLKEIRMHTSLKKLPVYVLTTSHTADDKRKALQLGATGFYSKGGSYKELQRVVKEVCAELFI